MNSFAYSVFFTIFIFLYSVYRLHTTFFLKTDRKKNIQMKELYTLWLLTIVHSLIILTTVIEYFYINKHKNINLLVSFIGILTFLLSLALRHISIKTLREQFSYNIEILVEHKLIRDGIYRYMRHPIYLGTILELVSFPLVGNAYYSFFASIIFYMPLLGLRLFLEEKALIAKFGEEYLQYKKETPILWPQIRKRKIIK